VTYRVEFHASALAQLHGIPSPAFDAMVARVSQLVDAPWEARILETNEPSFRQCTFGDFGLLSFHLDDARQLIMIFDLTWVG
jgi:mRNA-degrading endonuclease RelE of RelBE toxin-antitoxin system